MKHAAPRQRFNLRGKRIAIVCARFYPELADQLLEGAKSALHECGAAAKHITTYEVSGCFELPIAAARAIARGRFDAVIALGAVIRGQTAHFNYIAGECARGLMDVQVQTGRPIGFGVLTTDTYEQAAERADPKRGNKGHAAAMAAASVLQIHA